MHNYTVTFYYDTKLPNAHKEFTELARGDSMEEVAEVVAKQLEKRKFIVYPGGLIPVSCIMDVQIKKVRVD